MPWHSVIDYVNLSSWHKFPSKCCGQEKYAKPIRVSDIPSDLFLSQLHNQTRQMFRNEVMESIAGHRQQKQLRQTPMPPATAAAASVGPPVCRSDDHADPGRKFGLPLAARTPRRAARALLEQTELRHGRLVRARVPALADQDERRAGRRGIGHPGRVHRPESGPSQ